MTNVKSPAIAPRVERSAWYVHADQNETALALATLGDYLDDCFEYEIDFISGDD